ncbi:MAG: acyl carrier protein [Bacteroidales bacterium]|nr:acyl carrier protein [Bacteroidales bacterium]
MKSLDEFCQLVAEQFENTPSSSISPSTEFKKIDEYRSLVALSILAMIDEEFDVQLRSDDMRSASTVEDLYNKVKSYCE